MSLANDAVSVARHGRARPGHPDEAGTMPSEAGRQSQLEGVDPEVRCDDKREHNPA